LNLDWRGAFAGKYPMRFKTANSSLVSGSGLVLSIYQICAYGPRDQAKFVAKINQIQSAMDARKLP
jgi:hypothetical protein